MNISSFITHYLYRSRISASVDLSATNNIVYKILLGIPLKFKELFIDNMLNDRSIKVTVDIDISLFGEVREKITTEISASLIALQSVYRRYFKNKIGIVWLCQRLALAMR